MDVIRAAVEADVGDLHRLICELAVYEREPDAVAATEADLRRVLFAEPSSVWADVVETDGRVVAMALWFLNYSTWTGRNGIYLEDLFVEPAHRGRGLGRALLATLARRCIERDYTRLEWSVLDWNTPAIGFYEALGARPQDEWTVHRLQGDALRALAARDLRMGG